MQKSPYGSNRCGRASRILILAVVFCLALDQGCTLLPKTTLSDKDIPTQPGTTYSSYQSATNAAAVSVSFNLKGPWDFTAGPKDVIVRSRLVQKIDAINNDGFSEASYAEKVLPSDYTGGFTAYNYASISKKSLNSYGQSFSPGISGPIIKKFDRPERLLVFPVRVGDAWKDTVSVKASDQETTPIVMNIERTVVARGQVKVPAGAFFDCFLVRVIKYVKAGEGASPEKTILYVWWAPGIGPVAAIGSQQNEKALVFSQADYVFRLKSYNIK